MIELLLLLIALSPVLILLLKKPTKRDGSLPRFSERPKKPGDWNR